MKDTEWGDKNTLFSSFNLNEKIFKQNNMY